MTIQEMAAPEVNKKTIDNYKSDYEYFTGKASEINRSLALGGIAIIWIFKNTSDQATTIPDELICPLILLALSLLTDLSQYIIGGLIWFCYYKYLERKIKNQTINANDDNKAPFILPLIIHLFYWSKLLLNILAYAYIFYYLKSKII